MTGQGAAENKSEIGYVLKSYPRMSETFIANEIYLLEQLGLRLRLFSLLNLTDPQRHAVVDATTAPVQYLPQLSSLNESSFPKWLWNNAPQFAHSHWQLFKTRPLGYFRTLLLAFQFAFKYRMGSWRQPATSFFKEFLQAGFIAEQVLAIGTIGHLHAHFCHSATTVGMMASRMCGVPFSFTAHAKDIYVQALNPGDLLPTKLRQAKFAVTCTEANHAHLSSLGIQKTPIHTIYHGLNTRQFTPRQTADSPSSAPLLLTVGRMVEKKGFPTLLQACRLLKESGQQFQCLFISGAGVREQEIVSLIDELGLTDVVSVQPAVTQEELQKIYHQATVFVLPCQIAANGDRDGIPNVLVEAMAAGLPVVSTNVSGIPELIESGISGLLVPEKDAQALASAIAQLIKSPDLRKSLSHAAREKVCQLFDAEQNIRTLNRLFQDSLTEGNDN